MRTLLGVLFIFAGVSIWLSRLLAAETHIEKARRVSAQWLRDQTYDKSGY